MIAVDDIGHFGANVFIDADKLPNVAFDIAGDAVTMTQAAAALGELTGKTVTVPATPHGRRPQEQRGRGQDDRVVRVERLLGGHPRAGEKVFSIQPLTFREWVGARSQRIKTDP